MKYTAEIKGIKYQLDLNEACDLVYSLLAQLGRQVDYNAASKVKEKSLKEFYKLAAEYFGLKVTDLIGGSRVYAHQRHLVIYVTSVYTKLSKSKIGRIFGIDHSTVIYAINKVSGELSVYKDTKTHVFELSKMIKSCLI